MVGTDGTRSGITFASQIPWLVSLREYLANLREYSATGGPLDFSAKSDGPDPQQRRGSSFVGDFSRLLFGCSV